MASASSRARRVSSSTSPPERSLTFIACSFPVRLGARIIARRPAERYSPARESFSRSVLHLHHLFLRLRAPGPLALVLRQQRLAEADALGGSLHQLVVLDVLQRLLEGHLPRGLEDDVFV